MNISIRNEAPADYLIVEELTREAFWGCIDHPTCDGEHLLVHKLRKLPSFIPELDFVAEADGKIVGHVIYSLAKVVTPDNKEIRVLNFGPLSVHPNYKRMGVGSALMHHSISKATKLGYRAIVFYGHPDYYPRFGFRRASHYGITSYDGRSFDALMAMELYDGALDGVTGRYFEDDVFNINSEERDEFEKDFPRKELAQLLPIEILTDQLTEQIRQAFVKNGIKYVAQLQRFSGTYILSWDGMSEALLLKINKILKKLGQPEKLLPSSYIFQLTEMGVRNPICTLIYSKDGISLYRVKSEGKSLILKVFENKEYAREIENYRVLSSLDITTLPLLGYTKNAILLPDVEANTDYRLGEKSDLDDPNVARAIAKWYRELHSKGMKYLAKRKHSMYDETDILTLDNMEFIAEKTDTKSNPLWRAIDDNYEIIRNRIDLLPRTLTYNDFYYTNLIVAKNHDYAFMFDYNLLGKGIAYGDIRNVTSSLSQAAAKAFMEEYGTDIAEKERKADAFIAPVVTLYSACKREKFPSWANESLEKLKNGDILRHLNDWLNSEV